MTITWTQATAWFEAYQDAAEARGLDLVRGITVEQDALLCAAATAATRPARDNWYGRFPA